MALAALSQDEQRIIFNQLCNPLDPGIAVAFSSASSELRALTQAPRQRLQADHQAATALCRKARKRSCKELREAKQVELYLHGLSADDLALLGTLGSVLPALEGLHLTEPKLTRLTTLVALSFSYTRIADASCAVLAAALDSVLPSLERVNLHGIPASAAERDAMLRLGMDHGLAVEWLDPVYK